MNLGSYQKTVAALVTGVIGWGAVVVASPDAAVSASEWLMLATILATGLGVYAVPNAVGQVRRQLNAKPKDSGATDLVAVGLFLLLLAFAYLVLVHAGAL